MSRIVVTQSVSLDGVMQAPAGPDEDRRGGFEHGGWAQPYNDEIMGKAMGAGIASTGALLLGRRTYESFYSFWPHQTDNLFTDVLNNTRKYVASTTLAEPLPWVNSTLITGADVAELRGRPGKDIAILGSGELVRWLMRRDLIDAYVLLIHPLLLGAGRRLFDADGPGAALRLVDSVTTGTGVVIATYETGAS